MKKIQLGGYKKGTKIKGYALISDEDFEEISKYRWYLHPDLWNKYVNMKKDKKTVYLHRFLMNAKKGQFVDHINGDGLDNRRENLRLCTNAQNGMNRKMQKNNVSGFRGVYSRNNGTRWEAQIYLKSKRIYLGNFDSAEKAAHIYDLAALKYHGEFARLNFPEGV